MAVDTAEVYVSPKDLPLSKWQAQEGEVKLFCPDFEGLSYGPGAEAGENMIQFGPKGGFAPHEWVGPGTHYLLEPLLNAYPSILVVSEEQQQVLCGQCAPPRPFKNLRGFHAHNNAAHKSSVVKTAVESPPSPIYQTSDDGRTVTISGQRYTRVETPPSE